MFSHTYVQKPCRPPWSDLRADRSVPFAHQIHPKLKIPVNALALVCICCGLISLINLGSSTAFFAILSLGTLALYISYIVPTTLILIRKLEGRHPAYGPFKLGRWGIPINLFAIVYALYVSIWVSFPVVLPVTASTMNYAAPLWLVVLLLALGDWFTSGKKRFKVPVVKQGDRPSDD
jgi:amino acid transporter